MAQKLCDLLLGKAFVRNYVYPLATTEDALCSGPMFTTKEKWGIKNKDIPFFNLPKNLVVYLYLFINLI